MKRFVWPLQRVLDVRKKQEQIKKTELLRLSEKLAQTRGKLLVQQRILRNIISAINAEEPQKRLSKQQLFIKCSQVNDELINKLKTKIKELEKQYKDKIAEVLRLRQFRQAMEQLRARTKIKFLKAQQKLEQKQMDERAVIGFIRKQTTGAGQNAKHHRQNTAGEKTLQNTEVS